MGDVWASIVIVSFNSGSDLQTCVNHLARQTFPDFEVVIVDNDSPGEEFKNLQLPDSRFRIIKSDRNLGFAGGSNFGAKQTTSPWIITLNPDAWPEPDWLMALHNAAQIYQDSAILSSTIVTTSDPNILESFGNGLSIFGFAFPCGNGTLLSDAPDGLWEVFAACGAAAAYNREMFFLMEGFDESFFCYLEDIDLAYRIRLAGGKCIHVSDAIVKHVGSSSSDMVAGFRHENSARNNTGLIVKNTPLFALLIILPTYILASIWLIFRTRKNHNNRARRKGFISGLKLFPIYLKKRKNVFSHSKINLVDILKKMSWAPSSLRRTPLDIWEIK